MLGLARCAAAAVPAAGALRRSQPPPYGPAVPLKPSTAGPVILLQGEEEDEGKYEAYACPDLQAANPGLRTHPDPLVESASLASVPLPPLDGGAHLLQEVVKHGKVRRGDRDSIEGLWMQGQAHQDSRSRLRRDCVHGPRCINTLNPSACFSPALLPADL